MSKEYTIQEVFKFPVGTEFKVATGTVETLHCFGTIGIRRKNSDKQLNLTEDWLNAKYTLVRKELAFFEAMRLASLGKSIESCLGRQYRGKCGILYDFNASNGYGEVVDINTEEIEGKWYEVEEE